jgi:hypothetical protein
MGTVKADPPRIIWARVGARLIGFGKRDAAVAFNFKVVFLAVPWVPGWNANVAASVSHAVVHGVPLKTKMIAL